MLREIRIFGIAALEARPRVICHRLGVMPRSTCEVLQCQTEAHHPETPGIAAVIRTVGVRSTASPASAGSGW
jgi:hypothetical protein